MAKHGTEVFSGSKGELLVNHPHEKLKTLVLDPDRAMELRNKGLPQTSIYFWVQYEAGGALQLKRIDDFVFKDVVQYAAAPICKSELMELCRHQPNGFTGNCGVCGEVV